MQTAAHIGQTIVIKGQMTASEEVTVSGRIEGSIKVEGHALTVAQGASIAADVHATDVIVRGKVEGAITADRRIELGPTADVDGELEAPAIAVADGAKLSGRVETTAERKSSLQLVS